MAKFISAYKALEVLSDAVWGWLPVFPLKLSEFSEEEGEALLSGVAMMIKSILDCSTYDVPAWLLMDNGIIGNGNDEEFKACADKRFSEFAEFVHKIIVEAKEQEGGKRGGKMSVSLWRWSEECEGEPCCGDCDECGEEDDDDSD